MGKKKIQRKKYVILPYRYTNYSNIFRYKKRWWKRFSRETMLSEDENPAQYLSVPKDLVVGMAVVDLDNEQIKSIEKYNTNNPF